MCRTVTFRTWHLKVPVFPSGICKVGSVLHNSTLTVCKIFNWKSCTKRSGENWDLPFLATARFLEQGKDRAVGVFCVFGLGFFVKVFCFYLSIRNVNILRIKVAWRWWNADTHTREHVHAVAGFNKKRDYMSLVARSACWPAACLHDWPYTTPFSSFLPWLFFPSPLQNSIFLWPCSLPNTTTITFSLLFHFCCL